MDRDATILVTGASGFIGRTVVTTALDRGRQVRGLSRLPKPAQRSDGRLEWVQAASDMSDTALIRACRGIRAVIHLAARAHVMVERAPDPRSEYLRVNLGLTERLARAALANDVERFVFVSSIGVNGAAVGGRPLREDDPPDPRSPYAEAKWEAEQELARLAAGTSMSVTVVRPPLVYGPGARGNLSLLMSALVKGAPLPLASIRNARSLVGVDNLADFLLYCVDDHATAGQLYLVADDQTLSTPDIIRHLAAGLGVKARLFPVPPAILHAAGRVVGRLGMVEQLSQSLEVDNTKARTLGWTPLENSCDGLRRMASGFHPRQY